MAANFHPRPRPIRPALTLAVGLWILAAALANETFHRPSGPTQASQPQNKAAEIQPIQSTLQANLAKGKLLVAAAELGDSNFAETVVLLTDYNEEGAMGIILNRATRIKLAELLPRIESLAETDDTVYEGGPVERSEILMLVRSAQKPEDSELVFGDVYLSSSADLLKRLAKNNKRQKIPFRIYSGYAGWAPGQLEAEAEAGAWHVFPATASIVFAPQPEDLWDELIGRTTLRLAFNPLGARSRVARARVPSVSIVARPKLPRRARV